MYWSEEIAFRLRVWGRSNGRCVLCDRPVAFEDMDLDHIIPKSKNGTATEGNLRATHATCNRTRGNREIGPELKAWLTIPRLIPRGELPAGEESVSARVIIETFGLKLSTLYKLVQTGRLPFVDVTPAWSSQRRYRFFVSEVTSVLGEPEPGGH